MRINIFLTICAAMCCLAVNAEEVTVSRAVTPGTYESFCLPFDVNVKDIRTEYFDKIYCMTGNYVDGMPVDYDVIPSAKAKGRMLLTSGDEEETASESIDFSSYNDCQPSFVLWQNTPSTGSGQVTSKTFHVFMVGMPDTYEDEDGELVSVIPAGTSFYALVKTGVESITFTGEPDSESDNSALENAPMIYNYQNGVSTTITFNEAALLNNDTDIVDGRTVYAFSSDGIFTAVSAESDGASSLALNKAYILTSEPVDNIVVHYDKGTWDEGGWDSVVAMVKAATVGDVNRDGRVDILDATHLVNYLGGNTSPAIDKYAADVDSVDGSTPGKADVEALSNMILAK